MRKNREIQNSDRQRCRDGVPVFHLLMCDDLAGRLPEGVSYPELFAGLFERVMPSSSGHWSVCIYRTWLGELPEGFREPDWYVVSGSRASSLADEPWIRRLAGWIAQAMEAGVRMSGFCFGHQLIARVAGGRVERASAGLGLGIRESRIVSQEMRGALGGTLRLSYSHYDQVTEVPCGAEVLAESEFCPVEALGYAGGRVVTFQGHPEFGPGVIRHLVEHPADGTENRVLECARKSLSGGRPAGEDVVRWIWNRMGLLPEEEFVLDSHCDTPSMLLEGTDLCGCPQRGHVDFGRMRSGGVDGAFFALYTPNTMEPDAALRRVLRMLAATEETVERGRAAGLADFAVTPEQASANRRLGLRSVLLGMENGAPMGKDLSLLRFFYRRGVRYLTLTHNGHNQICDSAAPPEPRWGGLSPFGREVVAEMNRIGMLVDVSHCSDATFEQVLSCSKAPVVATHSCCRALCPHPRNLTDAMIRSLAARGGVMQVNFYPAFLDEEFSRSRAFAEADARGEELQREFREALESGDRSRAAALEPAYTEAMRELGRFPAPSFRRVADHIDRAVHEAGWMHVGLGSDFDGISVAPDGLRDIGAYGNLRQELLDRGYREEAVRAILGGNFLRVMRQAAVRD